MWPAQTHTNWKWPRHLDAVKVAFETHCGGIKLQEKKTASYQEQDRQKVAAYQKEIKDIPLEKIAYVDESGIDTYLYREYGYALRGQQVFGQVRGRKYQRCGIVAAQIGITSAGKDRKAKDGGRNWKRQRDDAVICA